MRNNCSAAPRLQHCVEITSVSFTVSAVLSRSRLGLEGNCLGLVLVSADSENKCLCLVSVSNTNCLVSAEAISDPTLAIRNPKGKGRAQIRIEGIMYKPLFSRTVIFAVLARCDNSRGVNFTILLMLSLL